jgi:chromosome segregation ATPase
MAGATRSFHLSNLPDHVEGLADPGAPDLVAWVRASFDAVRGELAALVANLDLQNQQVTRLARAEHEAVALARSLPDRIGEAIAAALDAPREATPPQSEGLVETFRATLREIKAEVGELSGQVGDQHRLSSTSTDHISSVAETVQTTYDRLHDQLERLDQQLSGVPDQTAGALDNHLVPVRERLDRLDEDLARLAVRDTVGDLRGEIQGIPRDVEATVRDVVADAIATSLGDLRAAIDAVTDSVTATLRPEIARIGADAATTRSQLAEGIADLGGRIDATGDPAGRSAAEAGAALAEEIRVEVTDALVEVRRTLNDLVARDPVATSEVRELNDAVTARLDLMGAQLASTTGSGLDAESLARMEASLDELRGAIGRVGQQLAEPGDDPEIGHRLDALSERIDAIGRVETVHRAIADLDARLSEAVPPESAPLDELQASVQRLAAVIRELGTREETAVDRIRVQLDGRLDAIGEQISAIEPSAPAPDLGPQLIALRDEIRDQLDAIRHQESGPDLASQFDAIQKRLDQLDAIQARVDQFDPPPLAPDPMPQLDAIAARLEGLASVADVAAAGSEAADARAASHQSADVVTAMAQRIDDRLADLSTRINALPDGRDEIADLAARVDDVSQHLGEQLGALANALASTQDRSPAPPSTENIEARVEQLSAQMDTAVQLLRRLRRRKPLQAKRKAAARAKATPDSEDT